MPTNLDELLKCLLSNGYVLSRSALYLRMQPPRTKSIEGRRHRDALPIRLIKAENDDHKSHVDGRFAAASFRWAIELSELLGPRVVSVVSQDDKAKVLMGLPAAQHQAPLLVHLEYKVQHFFPNTDEVI